MLVTSRNVKENELAPGKDFVYLGTAINGNIYARLEIQGRVAIENGWYYGLGRQLGCRALSLDRQN